MKASSDKIFIGTMSGTSHDGIDVCAIKVTNQISLSIVECIFNPIK
ncbi:hypothetical protein N9T33_05590 [Pseudomonadota bacterium]|nr:hypothetical protein [Pseudomonadota bacterium]